MISHKRVLERGRSWRFSPSSKGRVALMWLASKTWSRAALIVFVMLVAGVAVASPFFVHKGGQGLWMVNTHDMVQHLAVMKDFDKVLRSGIPYPRWLPDINNGYGIPWMNFYPPGFYYLASLVNAVLNDWVLTLFVISVLGFAASGLAFYWLARTFYSQVASVIAALLYMLLPYHVLNLYWQGAMPQFLGFIFLPLTLLFAFRVGAHGRALDYAGLGLFYGGYLMTHAPVSFLMTYTLALYALIWSARKRDWKIAYRIGAGMLLGLSLGAIYWLPAATETKDIQEHFSAIFPYHTGYITLLPAEGFGNLINQSFALQAAIIITVFLIFRAFTRAVSLQPSLRAEETRSTSSGQTRLWMILAAVTTFMSTSFSIYVSKLLPKIQVATFPWRWLAISALLTALLVGAVVDRWRDLYRLTAARRSLYSGALVMLIALSLIVTIGGVIGGALSNSRFEPPLNYVEAGFTPVKSTVPQSLPETPPVVIQPESGASEIIRWEPYRREIAVRLDQPSDVRIKTYNFPGWTARVDGEKAQVLSDKDGVQLVSVPAGRHKVETAFVNTPTRTAGTVLSALGCLTVIGLTVLDHVRKSRVAETPGPLHSHLKPVAVLAAIVLIGGALVLLNSRGRSGSAPAAKVGASRTVVGDATLHVDGASSVLVASDEKSLGDLMNALPTRDESRVDALVQSGQILRVANDIPVRVLEYGSTGKTRVRILEGEHVMAEVWAPERWVR